MRKDKLLDVSKIMSNFKYRIMLFPLFVDPSNAPICRVLGMKFSSKISGDYHDRRA